MEARLANLPPRSRDLHLTISRIVGGMLYVIDRSKLYQIIDTALAQTGRK